MAISKHASRTTSETTLRHVWLAGLGLVAVTRREAMAAAGRAAGDIALLTRRIERVAAGAQGTVAEGMDGVRGQVEPMLAQLGDDVQARLAPVLAKLGLQPNTRAPRKSRTPAAKKATRRAAASKPAKRTARKTRG